MTSQPIDTTGPTTWTPIDLRPALDGTLRAVAPTVGSRSDGVGLLYPGKKHTVAAESEAGKTWLACMIAATELGRGHVVVFLDFEDSERELVSRLRALSVADNVILDRFLYVRPTEPVRALRPWADLQQSLLRIPSVVVLDGVTEAMVLHQLDPNGNADVARFAHILLDPLAAAGSAVLALDHVTKAREARGRYAIGAVHKLNNVDGAAFTLESRSPFGRGLAGHSTLYVAKDRPGHLREHASPGHDRLHRFAEVMIESLPGGGVDAAVLPPGTADSDQPFEPTVLMGRVVEVLRGADERLSQRSVESRVQGRSRYVRKALDILVDDGVVLQESGPRNSKMYRLAEVES